MGQKAIYKLANLTEVTENKLSSLKSESLFDAVILNTNFDYNEIGRPSIIHESDDFIQETYKLIDTCCSHIKDGGLIFIYGLPNYLSFFGEYLSDRKRDEFSYLFKYWIACEYRPDELSDGLPTAHIGLLLYLKSKSKLSPTPFNINTKYVRVPYANCPSCGNTTKDWGGKKHLINPLGSAISDVWTLNGNTIKSVNIVGSGVVERILALLSEGKEVLLINQSKVKAKISIPSDKVEFTNPKKSTSFSANKVVHQSCIDYLNQLSKKHPEGVFDLAFADPPYNLAKNYSKYEDDLEERKYVDWCNEWLLGMLNNLKEGGALFVLNIPKWAIYHFNFLADKMIFRNWIVWDALSTPAGKLLPAHYSLLYFTKRGSEPKIILADKKLIDSREYCLRGSCIKKRKSSGDDRKELLSDIWKDIHRIKHKKDRDHHPCQLPTKLMKRIIELFSDKNDIIFDPFGGAGTTAIAAKLLHRKYVITELDEQYVKISERNIAKIQVDMFGSLFYERESILKTRTNGIPRKQIEDTYINLCVKDKKVYLLDELIKISPETYELVEKYQGSFSKLQGATRRKIETLSLFTE